MQGTRETFFMYDLADYGRTSLHVHDVSVLQIKKYRHRRDSSTQAMLLSLAINGYKKRPEVVKNHRAELSVPVQAASCPFVLCMMQSSHLLIRNMVDLQKCCMFIHRPKPWYD
jgi:acyl-CoA hydrolase